jgi:hypothetical protein
VFLISILYDIKLYDIIITSLEDVMIMRSKSRCLAFTEATAAEMVMPTTFLRALTTAIGVAIATGQKTTLSQCVIGLSHWEESAPTGRRCRFPAISK